MSAFFRWRPSAEQREALRQNSLADGEFSIDYCVLMVGAAAIATFGLLQNSAVTLLGAMLVAPLTKPIGALAYAAIDGNARAVRRAALTLAASIAFAIAFAMAVSAIVYIPTLGSEIMARSQPDLFDLGVALVAAAVAAIARIRPSLADALIGTAIAVSLLPPLCVVGIGFVHGDIDLARGSTLLFLTNLLGIMLASMLVFVICGYLPVQRAERGLVSTGLAVLIVIVPLAYSTTQLIRQDRLEAQLRRALANGTATFHPADVLGTDFDWTASPPEVTVIVRTRDQIVPAQVRTLETLARQRTGTNFKLILEVSPVALVNDGS